MAMFDRFSCWRKYSLDAPFFRTSNRWAFHFRSQEMLSPRTFALLLNRGTTLKFTLYKTLVNYLHVLEVNNRIDMKLCCTKLYTYMYNCILYQVYYTFVYYYYTIYCTTLVY